MSSSKPLPYDLNDVAARGVSETGDGFAVRDARNDAVEETEEAALEDNLDDAMRNMMVIVKKGCVQNE